MLPLYLHKYLILTILVFIAFLLPIQSGQGEWYTDENGRYTMWYPDNWDQTHVAGADIVFVDRSGDDFNENINVISSHVNGVRNTRNYALETADGGIEEIQSIEPDVTVISEPTAQRINGHWSATYIIDVTQFGTTVRASQTVILSEGYSICFIITCSALPSTFASYQDTFSESIDSFEVLSEPQWEEQGITPEGLFYSIIAGAMIGGVVAVVIFVMVNNKKKRAGSIEVRQLPQRPPPQYVAPPYPPRVPPSRYPPPIYPPRYPPPRY